MRGKSLDSLTERLKILFLLAFTRQLIRNSSGGIFELEHVLQDEEEKKEKKQNKELTNLLEEERKLERRIQGVEGIDKDKINAMFKPLPKIPQVGQTPRVLRIPETKLPPRFQYLKPIPHELDIDLGKLNPLIKDPLVKNIECFGPDQNIIVNGTMGSKPTGIMLSNDEINDVMERFSRATKIPFTEGVFKVVAGKLIFSAIISNVVGSKFIIRKMIYNPYFR